MQTQTSSFTPIPIGGPLHALPRKFIESILFLGDRMTHLGGGMREARAILRELAKTAGMEDYPRQYWFRDMTDERACETLDMDTAKRGALVLLSLLIKADPSSGEVHRVYFTRVRTKLSADPVTVPVSLEQHRRLATSFLAG